MMRFRSLSSIAFAAALALPSIASAQTYQMKVDDTGVPVVNFNQGPQTGPAIGPYHLESLNPVIAKFNAICIDLDNEVFVGQVWTARILTFDEVINNATNLAAVRRVLGTVPGWGRNELNASSILAQQFFTSPTSQWDEIHSAIWRMFSQGTPVPSDAAGSAALQATALAQGTSSNGAYLGDGAFTGWRLIVDDNAWNSDYRGTYTQTFISSVPEPSTYLLMGTGLFAIGLAARRRRRA